MNTPCTITAVWIDASQRSCCFEKNRYARISNVKFFEQSTNWIQRSQRSCCFEKNRYARISNVKFFEQSTNWIQRDRRQLPVNKTGM